MSSPKLYLANNLITSYGFQLICNGLIENKILIELDLRNNHITDQSCAECIRNLQRNQTLTMLHLHGNSLSYGRIKEIDERIVQRNKIRKEVIALSHTYCNLRRKRIIEIGDDDSISFMRLGEEISSMEVQIEYGITKLLELATGQGPIRSLIEENTSLGEEIYRLQTNRGCVEKPTNLAGF